MVKQIAQRWGLSRISLESLSSRIAKGLFDFLNVTEPPAKADCIFVLAGKEERKRYGIDLWRRGFAPDLILSVGRFEWRRFYALGLDSDGGLKKLVDSTKPQKRHFFVRFRTAGAEAYLIRKERLGTFSEGKALGELEGMERYGSLLVVSTSLHLRRSRLVLHRAFRSRPIRLNSVAVPEEESYLTRAALSRDPESRAEVFREFFKYIGYLALGRIFR